MYLRRLGVLCRKLYVTRCSTIFSMTCQNCTYWFVKHAIIVLERKIPKPDIAAKTTISTSNLVVITLPLSWLHCMCPESAESSCLSCNGVVQSRSPKAIAIWSWWTFDQNVDLLRLCTVCSLAEMSSDFCGSVAAGSKVMVVWGELQEGGAALQVLSLRISSA